MPSLRVAEEKGIPRQEKKPIHGSGARPALASYSRVRAERATRLFLRLGNIMRTYAEDTFV